jgi:uncharacterized SAM-binding protein YcdF (DUF218 family)
MPRYLILSFSFILLVLFFLNLGNFLDISEESKKTELIVCLGGGEKDIRIKKAISIYKDGGLLLITGGTSLTKKDSMKDDRISYLVKYPNIKYEYNPFLDNTADELFYIKKFILEHNMKKVSIVSDPYHSRRIEILANLFDFKKVGIELNIVGSELKWWNKSTYYKEEKAREAAFSELIKIPYNFIKYGLLNTEENL